VAVSLITGIAALGFFSILIKQEQQRTEANFRLARDAVDQMLTELGEVELADVPQMEPVRKKMLSKALAFYQKFLKEHGSDLTIRQETGRANIRLGDILEMLGDYQGAEGAYDRAVSLLEPLTAKSPSVAAYRRDLARARHDLGVLEKKSLRFEEAERNLTAARRMRRQIVVEFPENPEDLRDAKDSVYQLGALLARLAGRQGEAEANYQEAVRAETKLTADHPGAFDYQRKLARYRNNHGMLIMGNDLIGAEEEFEAAFALQDKLAKESPTVAGLQWERARSLSNLGAVLIKENKVEQAVATYQQAVESLKRLSDQFPSIPDYQSELAAVYANLGFAIDKTGKTDLAETTLGKSIAIYERLVIYFPHRPDYPKRMSDAERNLSVVVGANKRRLPEAEKWCGSAQEILTKLVHEYPMVPEYQSALGMSQEVLSRLFYRDHDLEKSRKMAEQAIEHQRLAMQDSHGYSRSYRDLMLKEFDVLTGILKQQGDHNGAVRAAGDVVQILREDPIAHGRAARLMSLAAELVSHDSEIPERERNTRALNYGDKALEHLRQAVRYGLRSPKELDQEHYKTIREREEFKGIRKDLEAKAKPPVV